MSDLRDRLRKLLALANGNDTAEGPTARKLAAALLAKYGDALGPDAEPETRHVLAVPPGTLAILKAICDHLNLTVGLAAFPALTKRGKRSKRRCRDLPVVLCTDREFEVVCRLHAYSSAIYKRRQRAVRAELKSWLHGHLDGLYPSQSRDRCPVCKRADYDYDEARGRFVCHGCGHRGGRGLALDAAAYSDGLLSAREPVPGMPARPQLEGIAQ